MNHQTFFFKVLDLLEENNIEYTFICGTLLGAIRDGDFIASDPKDTDIALKDNDYWKIRYLINSLLKEDNCFFKVNYIYRKELALYSLDDKYKVDLFFLEKTERFWYMYSYEQDQKTKIGRWTSEWRMSFPVEWIFPTKSKKFLGRRVSIPNEAEKILQYQYGDLWKTPDPSWKSNLPFNRDTNYIGCNPGGFPSDKCYMDNKEFDFAYVCVNFLRPEDTKKCITSLKEQYPKCKIYMADQDMPSSEMLELYEYYEVEYYYLPYDCGLSYCRNFLINRIKEPYIMWGDNDFIFDKRSNIYKGIDLLNALTDVGVIGGLVLKNEIQQHYERVLLYSKEHNLLVYVPLELTDPKEFNYQGMKYYYCDLTFNYAIAKKDLFNNKAIRWNENVKVRYEHTDIFLKFKLFSNYKVVYFPEMQVIHEHSFNCETYNALRTRKSDAEAFAKYWDLKMCFTIGKEQEKYNKFVTPYSHLIKQVKDNNNPVLEDGKLIQSDIKIEEKIPEVIIPKIETDIDIPITQQEVENKIIESVKQPLSLQEILLLIQARLPCYCYIKETCLDLVRHKTLIVMPKKIHILLSSVEDREALIKIFKDKYIEYEFEIDIDSTLIRKNKILFLDNYEVNIRVPMPVVPYLESKFGNNWQTYKPLTN